MKPQMQLTHAYGANVRQLNDMTCLKNGQLQTHRREHGPLRKPVLATLKVKVKDLDA